MRKDGSRFWASGAVTPLKDEAGRLRGEAYFGVNDFFPFTRAELRESEPEIYDLLREIWEAPSKENR